MPRAVAPPEMPATPDDYSGWRRSRRAGSVYHLHAHGRLACRRSVFDRNGSETLASLGDAQYWGLCPRCLKISERPSK